jgi:tetratricopeptide (TPR) repeat protein
MKKQKSVKSHVAAPPSVPQQSQATPSPRPEKSDKTKTGRGVFVLPGLMILFLLFLWSSPLPNFTNPWNEATALIDLAQETKDPVMRKQLMDEGGNRLLGLLKQHPYHARLQYYMSHYYMVEENYDSAIVYAHRAILRGRGGTVNRVEDAVLDLLAMAVVRKADLLARENNYPSAIALCQNSARVITSGGGKLSKEEIATSIVRAKKLFKMLAILYYETNKLDSAKTVCLRIAEADGGDDENFYYLGRISATRKEHADAIFWLKKSLALNPQNEKARGLLAMLQNASSTTKNP